MGTSTFSNEKLDSIASTLPENMSEIELKKKKNLFGSIRPPKQPQLAGSVSQKERKSPETS